MPYKRNNELRLALEKRLEELEKDLETVSSDTIEEKKQTAR